MDPLYSISQIRQLEKMAIEQFNVPEDALMNRAGESAFNCLRRSWPNAKNILVICGPGNNGGDGFVLAKNAHDLGLKVTIYLLGDKDAYSTVAKATLMACQTAKMSIEAFGEIKGDVDLVVDAILGIGISKEVTGSIKEAITAINAKNLPVLALDVPSGVDADTGSIKGVAIKAHTTITFIGLKQGLHTNDAVDYCGDILLDRLDLPNALFESVKTDTYRLDPALIQQRLVPRRKNSHKGDFGHVLIIGGNKGMAGAARLAAEAALRVGAGLVSVATLPEHRSIILAEYPEIMCHGVAESDALQPLLERATVLVIGPGIGKDNWGKSMLGAVLKSSLPIVIDADALNLLGEKPQCSSQWVLTPHPGEAARLLGTTSKAIQANRFTAIADLAKLGGVWILKGAGTLVKTATESFVCPYGNPGMASGGMGDALTGIIAGLIAQRLSLPTAVLLGALIHSLAGDEAAKQGERGLVASDLIDKIRLFANS